MAYESLLSFKSQTTETIGSNDYYTYWTVEPKDDTTVYGLGIRASDGLLYYIKKTSSTADSTATPYNANTNTIPTAYCTTAAATAAKTANCTNYALLNNSYFMLTLTVSNTATSNVTLNINNKGAKKIYINGEVIVSANAKDLTAGTYLGYYDGTNYYLRNDGIIPQPILAMKASILPNVPLYFNRTGNIVEIYTSTAITLGSNTKYTGTTPDSIYNPQHTSVSIPVYSNIAPYAPIGSMWISYSGKIELYKPSNITSVYINGTYTVGPSSEEEDYPHQKMPT